MYICQKCKRHVGPYIPEHRIPIMRDATYPVRTTRDGKIIIDKGGVGREIASTVLLCPFCMVTAVHADDETRRMVKQTYMKNKTEVMLRSDATETSS